MADDITLHDSVPVASVEALALEQIQAEDLKEAVAKAKARLLAQRAKVPFWRKLFPWTIRIERRT